VSDVVNCDRGNYLPGLSTDGDIALVQAYEIGTASIKMSRSNLFNRLHLGAYLGITLSVRLYIFLESETPPERINQ